MTTTHTYENGTSSTATEEAVLVWNILFKVHPWKLYKKWARFVQQNTKAITSDVWNLLLDFATEYPNDISSFDPQGLSLI
jgi:hypothetical protein